MVPPPPGATASSPSRVLKLALRVSLILLATPAAWGTIGIDQVKSTDRSTLVRQTKDRVGTAEVWRAFAPSQMANVSVTATLSQSVVSSVTVVSFTGTDTSGAHGAGAIGATASSGAPTATRVTTRSNSWVLGAGHDWDQRRTA